VVGQNECDQENLEEARNTMVVQLWGGGGEGKLCIT
jgi:hypothetical protein